MMLLAGPAVYVVTAQAGRRALTPHDNIADVLKDVPVGRTQILDGPVGKVDLEVAKPEMAPSLPRLRRRPSPPAGQTLLGFSSAAIQEKPDVTDFLPGLRLREFYLPRGISS
jgi:hypothetical protein